MEKLAIAMSGGVDSSVALVLLKDKYDVSGYTLKLHDSRGTDDSGLCGSASDIEDAKAIAAKFGVPHYLLDMRDLFSDTVQKSFVQSYLSGRTPNPCVECNETIKFGALLDAVKKQGINHIATGHYVRSCYDEKSGRWLLKKAINADGTSNAKDQSYVLYRLSQQQLAASVFPLGEMTKDEIRHIAADSGLINSDKPDSQENCFIPDGDYPAYVEGRCGPSRRGQFIAPDGSPAGPHRGIAHYTVGQRKGLGIALGRPVFVRAIDPASGDVLLCDAGEEYAAEIRLREVCAPDPAQLAEGAQVLVKIRSVAKPCPATLHFLPGGELTARFAAPQRAPAPGQSAVFYRDGLVIGGGIIDRPRPENGGAAGGSQTTA